MENQILPESLRYENLQYPPNPGPTIYSTYKTWTGLQAHVSLARNISLILPLQFRTYIHTGCKTLICFVNPVVTNEKAQQLAANPLCAFSIALSAPLSLPLSRLCHVSMPRIAKPHIASSPACSLPPSQQWPPRWRAPG